MPPELDKWRRGLAEEIERHQDLIGEMLDSIGGKREEFFKELKRLAQKEHELQENKKTGYSLFQNSFAMHLS